MQRGIVVSSHKLTAKILFQRKEDNRNMPHQQKGHNEAFAKQWSQGKRDAKVWVSLDDSHRKYREDASQNAYLILDAKNWF